MNVGCGRTPTPGWLNYDNSLSVRFAKYPLLLAIADRLGLVGGHSMEFAAFARTSSIRWAHASKRIPLRNDSVDVLYTSHMLEHLDRVEAGRFLREAYRVLAPGGIIRVVVPNLRTLTDEYLADGDADRFIERTLLARTRPTRFIERLKILIVGDRHHLWMYDGSSLCRLLQAHGFRTPLVLKPGETTIPDPGALNLCERVEESVYVEGRK